MISSGRVSGRWVDIADKERNNIICSTSLKWQYNCSVHVVVITQFQNRILLTRIEVYLVAKIWCG